MKKVFVVEDNPLLRKQLVAMIDSMEGLEVVGTAENGLQAMERFAMFEPDIITMDIEMPGMNGLDAVSAIRTLDSKCRIIMVTSLSSKDKVFTAIRNGADNYVLKPFEKDKLKHALTEVLDMAGFF
jgi:two-component system, chemotaxis family, chemotaxis protein CheY